MKGYKKDYLVWCMVHNKAPNRTDFLGYLSDKKMLEKIKKRKLKKSL